VPGLVEWNDIEEIGRLIEGAERYYLQQFRAGGSTLDPSYAQITPYSQERLEEFLNIARKHVRVAEIRGI
jgi:pyruvate formate lyase activating enzyme